MDDIKIFAKNEKDLEKFIQTIKVYRPDIVMEFGTEKRAMRTMKSRKKWKEQNSQIRKATEHLEKKIGLIYWCILDM